MSKIFVVGLEDTKLVHRTELLDWLCSSEVLRGVKAERYWVLRTDTNIVNVYADPDVTYLMNILQRVLINDYQSIMILKYGTDYRGANSSNSSEQGENRKDEVQHPDNPPVGEIPSGEPRPEIPTSTTDITGSGERTEVSANQS